MSVRESASMLTSDQTRHRARSVGEGQWVVSYLPGRTLTIEQATAAMKTAEAVAWIGSLTQEFGLTAAEAIGLASRESSWPTSVERQRRDRWQLRQR